MKKKGAARREKKGSGVLLADQSSFATLFYYTITETGGPAYTQLCVCVFWGGGFWHSAKPAGRSAERPTIITRKWTQLKEPD